MDLILLRLFWKIKNLDNNGIEILKKWVLEWLEWENDFWKNCKKLIVKMIGVILLSSKVCLLSLILLKIKSLFLEINILFLCLKVEEFLFVDWLKKMLLMLLNALLKLLEIINENLLINLFLFTINFFVIWIYNNKYNYYHAAPKWYLPCPLCPWWPCPWWPWPCSSWLCPCS